MVNIIVIFLEILFKVIFNKLKMEHVYNWVTYLEMTNTYNSRGFTIM